MLFGAPLALLAAIYTSEFLQPRVRARVKPAIEMMASLPSVVLGFLAALVFAPLVERLVPAVLTSLFSVPLAFLLAAQLWQLLPQRIALVSGAVSAAVRCWRVLPLGLAAAWLAGPAVERLLFAGDMKRWLDGQVGDGTGGWLLAALPCCALATVALVTLYVNTWLRARGRQWSRRGFALAGIVKLLAGAAFTLALAYGLSRGLTAAGPGPAGHVSGHLRTAECAGGRVRDGLRDHSRSSTRSPTTPCRRCPIICGPGRWAAGRRPGRRRGGS